MPSTRAAAAVACVALTLLAAWPVAAVPAPVITLEGPALVLENATARWNGRHTLGGAPLPSADVRLLVDGVERARTLAVDGRFAFDVFTGPRGLRTLTAVADPGTPLETRTTLEVLVAGRPGPTRDVLTEALAGAPLVRVSWQPPEDDGGTPLQRYQVERKVADGAWTRVATVEPTQTEVVDQAVLNATHRYRVAAENALGRGPSTTVTLVAAAPGAPLEAAATLDGYLLTLTWAAPAEGGPLQAYVARGPWGGEVLPTNTTLRTHEVDRPGPHSLSVAGANVAGFTFAPEISVDVPRLGAPAPFSADAVAGVPRVRLAWTPAPDAGRPSLGWRVERSIGGGEWTLRADLGVDTTSYEEAVDLVEPYPTHSYRVTGRNRLGDGDPALADALPPLPGAPSGLSAQLVGYDITISWNAPASGGPLQAYDLVLDGAALRFDASVTSHKLRAVEPTTLRVEGPRALNVAGATSSGESVDLVVPPFPAPLDLQALAADGQKVVRVTWTRPPDDGRPADAFHVERRIGNGEWSLVASLGAFATSYEEAVTIAPPYPVHAYRVAGENELGIGTWAATAAAPALPGAPAEAALAVTRDGVLLTWAAPPSGGPVQDYRVYRGASAFSVPTDDFARLDVPPAGTHEYRVAAANLAGETNATPTPSTVVLSLPSPPRNVTADASQTAFNLSWEAPEDAGGAPVRSYQIFRRLYDGHPWSQYGTTDGETLQWSAPAFNKRYAHCVKAETFVGTSPPSNLWLPSTQTDPTPC